MKKFQRELFVTTVENNLQDNEYYNFRDLFIYTNGYKISFHILENTIPIIIDQIKKLFGLNSMNRDIIIFPSQDKYMIEHHKGYERYITNEEIDNYEVFKIRVFRWMMGLPHNFPKKDIIVRTENGIKSFISYKDEDICMERELRIDVKTDDYNIDNCIKEMLFDFTYDSLKLNLKKIIEKIDPKFIFISDFVVRKLNLHGYI